MDSVLMWGFAALQYIDPETCLRKLRRLEIELAHTDLPADTSALYELTSGKRCASGGGLRFSPMGWIRSAGLQRACGRAHRSRDGSSRLEPAL